MEISSLFASCLWSQSSFRYCVFFFNPSHVQSNGFKWISWDDRATRVTIFIAYYLSARTNYRRIGLSRSSDEYIFERFTLVWRCFTISLCLWLCACFWWYNTTCLFHLCKRRSDCSIPLPKNSFSLLSHFAPYHD